MWTFDHSSNLARRPEGVTIKSTPWNPSLHGKSRPMVVSVGDGVYEGFLEWTPEEGQDKTWGVQYGCTHSRWKSGRTASGSTVSTSGHRMREPLLLLCCTGSECLTQGLVTEPSRPCTSEWGAPREKSHCCSFVPGPSHPLMMFLRSTIG